MKKFEELTPNKKIITICLFFLIFMFGMFYLKEVLNPDNYKTIIDCGNGTILTYEGKHDINIKQVCPNTRDNIDDMVFNIEK
jgi:hypothetical protein